MQEPVHRVDRHALIGYVVKQELVQLVELFIGQTGKRIIHRTFIGSLVDMTGDR